MEPKSSRAEFCSIHQQQTKLAAVADYDSVGEPGGEANWENLLNDFANGNYGEMYGMLASFGQISNSGDMYASIVEGGNNYGFEMYDKAATYQLEIANRSIYMETSASKLSEEESFERLATMARAMSAHQGKYDALFATWSSACWIDDLDVQHRIVIRSIATTGTVEQPNPWAGNNGAVKVTSKRYMLKLLEVYGQSSSTSPVSTVATACSSIAAKLGNITFKLGPTKTKARIFEKVLANNGRFDLIRDYARATFVVGDVVLFPRLLQTLLLADEFKVIRAKNRLSPTWDSRDSAGYRD